MDLFSQIEKKSEQVNELLVERALWEAEKKKNMQEERKIKVVLQKLEKANAHELQLQNLCMDLTRRFVNESQKLREQIAALVDRVSALEAPASGFLVDGLDQIDV